MNLDDSDPSSIPRLTLFDVHHSYGFACALQALYSYFIPSPALTSFIIFLMFHSSHYYCYYFYYFLSVIRYAEQAHKEKVELLDTAINEYTFALDGAGIKQVTLSPSITHIFLCLLLPSRSSIYVIIINIVFPFTMTSPFQH